MAVAPVLLAQDTRTVTEPTIPNSCETLYATQPIKLGPTYPFGGSPEYQDSTHLDTGRIQTALDGCATGEAVTLAASPDGKDYAFLTGPLTLPAGVTLLINPGVTVFADLNPVDYQVSGGPTCGTISTSEGGCNPLISLAVPGTSGSGVMGYGVINGQSKTPLVNSGGTALTNPYSGSEYQPYCATFTWYCLTYVARNIAGPHQNNPKLIYLSSANNFTLYKTTLLNSPLYTVEWDGQASSTVSDGFTAWGVKIMDPHDQENTDGIDLEHNVKDATIMNSSISNGDDQMALDANVTGQPVLDVSVTNLNTFGGFGLAIGSETWAGSSAIGIGNVAYTGINQSGDLNDIAPYAPLIAGLHIKSNYKEGGWVDTITYNKICQQNLVTPIWIDPFFNGVTGGGTSGPKYTNITYQNYTDIGGAANNFVLQGHDSTNLASLTFSNFNVSGGTPNFDPSSNPPENLVITETGPGLITPAAFTTLGSSGYTDVTESGSTSSAPSYACSATNVTQLSANNFPKMIGELYGNSNLQTVYGTAPASMTLTAVIEGPTAESPAFHDTIVKFFQDGVLLGSGPIKGNGTYATYPVTVSTAGTHTYYAQYDGDSNYPVSTWGNVTFIVH